MNVRTMVTGYRDELVERLGTLVAINSTEGTPEPGAPFGAGPRDALHAALAMLEEDGFRTVNLDNYCGYAEFGEGKELIGVIGHLDVVPADIRDGWNTDPFVMSEKDGILYGRGVDDDKGAVVASMIALKVLRDLGVPVNKRIRLIMGTNEETGSRCLEHYVEKEGHVDYGFTPDGDFPGVHGEKGMVGGTFRSKNTNILDIHGGTAKNIVCSRCSAKVPKNCYSSKKLGDWFNNLNIEFTVDEEEDGNVITVFGKAAHASTPELGINAISVLFAGLREAGMQDPFVEFYCSHFGLATDGSGLNAKLEDEFGVLTLNVGMISMEDGVITGTIDIRSPVTMSTKSVLKAMASRLEDDNGVIEFPFTVEPLFFPVESPLVSSLLSAYQEVTGEKDAKPMTMGGGTYAKGIRNTIAFGCSFPGRDYHIHDANENVGIDELLLQTEIYVHALMKLLEL
ncbi:MAG: Sapep family Mn(2+)-dependent dipeptidase [Solobacterium sp.]|nr:Sapep family Mn(2+)-dependent dipeptidase [Solobacterium sp.]